MRSFLRPWWLVVVLAALLVGAAAVFFNTRPGLARPAPLPVGAGDREIVWLYPATNGAQWERFVTAVRFEAGRLRDEFPGIEAQTEGAFPPQTTAVPEVALSMPGGGRLLFRWYKLTSDWKARDWVAALAARRPPPLAVIGGSSSDVARDLALQLDEIAATLPPADQPLLLLTTATADRVAPAGSTGDWAEEHAAAVVLGEDDEGEGGVSLVRLYGSKPAQVSVGVSAADLSVNASASTPARTFRFCFTNRQMARAVCHFLWNQDDLRPDSDPVHIAQWEDDAYSLDLVAGFNRELRAVVAVEAARELSWGVGSLGLGGLPGLGGGIFPWQRAGRDGSGFRMAEPPNPQRIDFSTGSFASPNRLEEQAVRYLLADLDRKPQRRPLLVVTGQTAPCRRFLRGLARTAPAVARRFVVATGDALAFNTLYRDRLIAWPIQDLPFSLVSFCHHNPIDPLDGKIGFRPRPPRADGGETDGAAGTGTEDVLLFADIVEALAQAMPRPAAPALDAAVLAQRLGALQLRDGRLRPGSGGRPVFRSSGNRLSGGGEYIVCLRPRFRGERVLPEASIEVWTWQVDPNGAQVWQRVAAPLPVSYDERAPVGE